MFIFIFTHTGLKYLKNEIYQLAQNTIMTSTMYVHYNSPFSIQWYDIHQDPALVEQCVVDYIQLVKEEPKADPVYSKRAITITPPYMMKGTADLKTANVVLKVMVDIEAKSYMLRVSEYDGDSFIDILDNDQIGLVSGLVLNERVPLWNLDDPESGVFDQPYILQYAVYMN